VVLPVFDPQKVTYLVHCPRASKSLFLRIAGLKSLKEIPEHVPVVTWDWVVQSHSIGKPAPCIDFAKWREAPRDYEVDVSFADKLRRAKMSISRQNSVALDDTQGDEDFSRISYVIEMTLQTIFTDEFQGVY
jgi:hypothetical protein